MAMLPIDVSNPVLRRAGCRAIARIPRAAARALRWRHAFARSEILLSDGRSAAEVRSFGGHAGAAHGGGHAVVHWREWTVVLQALAHHALTFASSSATRFFSARSSAKRTLSSRIIATMPLTAPSGACNSATVNAIDIARPALSTAGTFSRSWP